MKGKVNAFHSFNTNIFDVLLSNAQSTALHVGIWVRVKTCTMINSDRDGTVPQVPVFYCLSYTVWALNVYGDSRLMARQSLKAPWELALLAKQSMQDSRKETY